MLHYNPKTFHCPKCDKDIHTTKPQQYGAHVRFCKSIINGRRLGLTSILDIIESRLAEIDVELKARELLLQEHSVFMAMRYAKEELLLVKERVADT